MRTTTSIYYYSTNSRRFLRGCRVLARMIEDCLYVNPHIFSSMLQGGGTLDECLSGVAATDDGGVVVGGPSNGTFNGVASEGGADFAAIKLGTSLNVVRFFCRVHHTLVQRHCCRCHKRPERSRARAVPISTNLPSFHLLNSLHCCTFELSELLYLLTARRGWDCRMVLAGEERSLTAIWLDETARACSGCAEEPERRLPRCRKLSLGDELSFTC